MVFLLLVPRNCSKLSGMMFTENFSIERLVSEMPIERLSYIDRPIDCVVNREEGRGGGGEGGRSI